MKSILRSSVNWLPLGLRHRIRRLPGIAPFQRWLVSKFLSGGSFVHTINAGPAAGLRIEVSLPMDKAIWAGTYEHDFAVAISAAVRPGDVCLDIGGYRGYTAGVMALAGASRVYVFEPLPANQLALARLRGLNPMLPIEVRRGAVSDRDGSAVLEVVSDPSMGRLETSQFQAGGPSMDQLEVSIWRLDSLVKSGDVMTPRIMKIDVEGAELEVLRGAADSLQSAQPVVFLEAHSGALEAACRVELAGHGYEIQRLESEIISATQARHLIARHACAR